MSSVKKIVLIDDEVDFCFFAKTNLESAGEFSLITVNDSLSAVDVVTKEQPAVVLMDIKMPGLSGPEIVRMLGEKSDTKDIPIVYLTAVMQIDGQMAAIPRDMPYLVKPVSTDDLIAAIKKYMR